MITRHRIPTIFSIYMMDVLCCALGCIILLWQVSFQEAEEKTLAASSSLTSLNEANQSILALHGELASLKATLEDSHKKYLQITVDLDRTKLARDEAAQLALVRKQEFDQLRKNHTATEALLASLRIEHKDLQAKSKLTAAQLAEKLQAHAELFEKFAKLQKNHTAAEDLIASLRIELKDSKTKNTLTAAQLADKLQAHAELLDKIAKAQARIVILDKDIDAQKLELLLATKRSSEQTAKLKDADERMRNLEKQLLDLRGIGQEAVNRLKVADLRIKMAEQDSDRGKIELADSKRKLQLALTEQDILSRRLLSGGKDMAEARAMIASLEGERISLINRAKNIQAAMENRFAGITLTGKKVIFLVDMSGSMELTDENTVDPDKWPLVCDTVGRLMQSLTDLRNFQVILFSDRLLYPLRNEGRWHEYVGPETAKQTVTALKAIKPKGGTNISIALEETFRFRGAGLDTVYFLSDGLPNDGAGLPGNVEKLTEQQKSEILSKHIRQRLKTDWNRYIAGQPRVRINTIGFFFESPDVGAFLWALSREHDGSFVGMSR